ALTHALRDAGEVALLPECLVRIHARSFVGFSSCRDLPDSASRRTGAGGWREAIISSRRSASRALRRSASRSRTGRACRATRSRRCEQIDLVGHSEGGLIGWYYVQKLDGAVPHPFAAMVRAPARRSASAARGRAVASGHSVSDETRSTSAR